MPGTSVVMVIFCSKVRTWCGERDIEKRSRYILIAKRCYSCDIDDHRLIETIHFSTLYVYSYNLFIYLFSYLPDLFIISSLINYLNLFKQTEVIKFMNCSCIVHQN